MFVLALIGFATAAAAQDMPPLPPPRPDRATLPEPEEQKRKAVEASDADAACIERLTRLGLRFESRPPVQEESCSVRNPVLVSALPGGVELSPAALMTCPFAEGLARWTSEVVHVEAERHFQSAPTRLLIGTSYQCRKQRSGGKLSEHALGNGVDVMGFVFEGQAPLVIGAHAENSPQAAFQSAVRLGACPIFSTVLGPGSDAAHGDHLHLDMRARKGDYRICQ